MLQRLQELVPEATFGVAHGRMPPESLEHVMDSFSAQEFDVLICTTIIQAGLDMPNVNTLIVDDADRLGLTQLYQLRGRVGRSSIRAYAYFLFRRDRVLTPTAERRLRAILSAAELGAGFRLAMKDLEIRGRGISWARSKVGTWRRSDSIFIRGCFRRPSMRYGKASRRICRTSRG